MRNAVLFVILTMVALSLGNFAFAYEGSTKLVAQINQSEMGMNERGPIRLIPSSQLIPTKPILRFLQEMPKPTLSVRGIREENRGHSTGETKASVQFLGGWF